MGFFPNNIQSSILLLAHRERLFFPRTGQEGAGLDCVIGKFQGTSKEGGASKKDRSEEGEGTLWQTVHVRNVRQSLE
jgi:hypothetical protein